MNLKTGKRTPFRRVGNVDIMEACIEKPDKAKKNNPDAMVIDNAERLVFTCSDAR